MLYSARPRAANCKEKRTKIKSCNSFGCNATETTSGIKIAKKTESFWEEKGVGQCYTEKDLFKHFLAASVKQCNSNIQE